MSSNKEYILMAAFICTVIITPSTAAAGTDHSSYKTIKQCVTCHPKALPTHRRQMPSHMSEGWPLDDHGRMLCITCHNCLGGSCVLRKKSDDLCRVCHDCSQGMGCLIGSAHLAETPELKASPVSGCMNCHDGSVGSVKGRSGDHTVNVLYVPNKQEKLKTVTDRRIVFIDGKVTCVSCHNPYKSTIAKLVKSNKESRLCLTCHLR
jgi:predicted CXXCH cytochrome family protein